MSPEYRLTLFPKTAEDADPKTKAVLEGARKKMGFVPNMYALMANSPGLLESYLNSYALFSAGIRVHAGRARSYIPLHQS